MNDMLLYALLGTGVAIVVLQWLAWQRAARVSTKW